MKSINLKDLLKKIKGTAVAGNSNMIVRNFSISPRKLCNETLYFDLYRMRKINLSIFNRYKSIAIITDRPNDFIGIRGCSAIIKVEDRRRAYWDFVEYYRGLMDIPIIGITGTCGKTTSKEMIKHILSKRKKVCSTYRNGNLIQYNSSYLISSDEGTGFGVFEMGLKKPGDLAASCKYLKPQIRILLNIGIDHMEGCGNLETYIKAKSEILEGIDPLKGVLILNADDENIKKIDISRYRNIIYFGFSEKSHFRGEDVKKCENGINFKLNYKDKIYKVFIPCFAEHDVYNALASIAAAYSAGIGIEEACTHLATFENLEKHLQILSGVGGCTIIDDSWNSNPISMEHAFKALKDISNGRNKVAIVSQMPCMGINKHAQEQYEKMGKKAVEAGIDYLIVIGEKSKAIGIAALQSGMNKGNVCFSKNGSDICDMLTPFLNKDNVILIKVDKDELLTKLFFKKIYSHIIK